MFDLFSEVHLLMQIYIGDVKGMLQLQRVNPSALKEEELYCWNI